MNLIPPIKVGDRIVVLGFNDKKVLVKHVDFIPNEARWVIFLDWGVYGTSKVYDHDEGKIWHRYGQLN